MHCPFFVDPGVTLHEKKYRYLPVFLLMQCQMICLHFPVSKDCAIILLLKSQNSKIDIFSHSKYGQDPRRRGNAWY